MNALRASDAEVDDSVHVMDRSHPLYPEELVKRLGGNAPDRLWFIGRPELIQQPKTALFCSTHCPADAIVAAMDQAQAWRDQGRTVISGFHSPVEKECLSILLRGRQPLIFCPARSIDSMRIPRDWRPAIRSSRLLILTGIAPPRNRMTRDLAETRNRLVAALSEEAYFAHIAPGGRAAGIAAEAARWGIPLLPA